MKEKFENYLHQNLGFRKGERLLIAVSGGMDSMMLWYLCRMINVDFIVAHCNFKLRNEESDGDEAFVKAFAHEGELVLTRSFETKIYAQERRISIQMAARDLRYEWFRKLKAEYNCNYIATAHHLDDQIETFFIQLLRNKSLPVISGMPVKTEEILRPLMFLGRESIEIYVEKEKISYREDSSNTSEVYLRNRIRKNLIPILQKTAPDFKTSLLELMSNLNEVSTGFDDYVNKKKEELWRKSEDDIRINIEDFKKIEFPEIFLEWTLRSYGFNKKTVSSIFLSLDAESGKSFYSKEYRLIKDREDLIIVPLSIRNEEVITVKKADLPEKEDFFINIELVEKRQDTLKDPVFGTAMLDFDELEEEVIFRKWREGDRFRPLGMKGSKKLSDYFIDNKFSLLEKERQWVMTSGSKICWIVGHAIDNRFKIRDKTKLVLILEQ